MTIQPGDLCKTNLSQPGGYVAVLAVEPSQYDNQRMAAKIQHVEDHPYGYKKGDIGWCFVDELLLVVSGYYITEDDES